MGNRARRRAWASRVSTDPRLSETDRQVALAIADMDRRGFTLCEREGEFYLERKDQWRVKMAA